MNNNLPLFVSLLAATAVFCAAANSMLAAAPTSDNFNSPALNTSLWTVVNPVGDGTYSLSGTNLLISVPGRVNHDIWAGGNNGIRVMQPITNVDFEVVVKMDSSVTAGSQMQGILIEQSATVFLRFDIRHDSASPRLFAASISGNTGTFRIDFALPGITGPFWLKVRRLGNSWTESYSTNGTSYLTGGTFSFNLTTTKIGLFAGNFGQPASAAPAFTASFDSFLNTAAAPDMTVTKTHTGNFTQGGTGTYTIVASNSGTASSAGAVTVTDTLPAGITATAFSGAGWSCGLSPNISCTRNDVLAAATSYPPLTLNVNVAANAPSSVTNTAAVSGGGQTNTANDSATDATAIQPPQQPPVISNVTATAGPNSAMVTWTTDKTSSSRVDYGATASYGAVGSDASLVTSHSVALSGLTCATTYQYKVSSTDISGNTSTSGNQSLVTSACVSGRPVSDNFDAPALSTSLWTFVNPRGDAALTLNGAELQITVPQGSGHDAWTTGNQVARVMQPLTNTDFQVEVRFNSAVMYQYQLQGVIVQQDAQNYIRFDTYHDGTSPRLFCATFTAGQPTVRIDTPIVASSFGPPFWLRVRRSGNTWTQTYSMDGASYNPGASFTQALNPTSIGPFAGNAQSSSGDTPAFTASVDYFFNSASPVANSSGPLLFDRFLVDPNPPTTTLLKTFADIDGDGRTDVVIGHGNPATSANGAGIWWYQNPRSGSLSDKWNRYPILRSGVMYEDIVASDVNLDGALDVIASFDGNHAIYWFENPRGRGGNPAVDPWPQHLIGYGTGENTMVLADIDGDGRTDLVTNGFIFFQNGPDTWVPITYNRMSNGLAALDIGSGKGAIHLLGIATFPPYPFVWLENPREKGGNARTDTWIAHVIGDGYDNTGHAPASFGAADLNGDGRMDVITAHSEGDNPASEIGELWWWEAPLDRRTGTWLKHVIDSTFTQAHNIRTADMNGDGAIDIVISEQEQAAGRRVSVFYNDGSGNFLQRILSNGSGHNLALGDVDGDGSADILNAGHGYYGAPHPVEIYRNRKN